MCEILLRVVDKVGTDPYNNSKLLKAGDVVMIVPDGWAWGTEELGHPDWRIISLPLVSVDAASAFLGPEFNSDPSNPSQVLRPRAFSFDLAHGSLNASFKSWLGKSGRSQVKKSLTITLAELMALKKGKTRLADPNKIG